MQMQTELIQATGDMEIHLTISKVEFLAAKFNAMDVALFGLLESDKMADKILALETIVRRIEEQQQCH